MHLIKNEIFDQVLHEYSKSALILYGNKKWSEMSEQELWEELCLCIFSSNVPYELAQSVFFHLLKKGYLKLEWIMKTPDSQKAIANELSKPIYLPRKLDGSYRRYRFPNLRARNVFQATKTISLKKGWLSQLLENSISEEEVRDSLVVNISGLGLKEASHFLRNIRYSNKLAIIDSHVISFLKEIGTIPQRNTKRITRNFYMELESRLQEICDKYGLDLSILDMAIWNYMRRK